MKYVIDNKEVRLSQWHNWFAWYPIRLNNDEGAWLETVERRGELQPIGHCGVDEWVFEYRVIS